MNLFVDDDRGKVTYENLTSGQKFILRLEVVSRTHTFNWAKLYPKVEWVHGQRVRIVELGIHEPPPSLVAKVMEACRSRASVQARVGHGRPEWCQVIDYTYTGEAKGDQMEGAFLTVRLQPNP